MIPFKFVKEATVTSGGSTINAPGSQNMPGAGYKSVSAGAASVPGMSVHCLTCGQKVKKGVQICTNCGKDVTEVAEASDKDAQQIPDSGVDQVLGESTNSNMPKYCNVGMDVAKGVFGGSLLVGGGVAGAKLTPIFKDGVKEERKRRAQELVAAGQLPESALLKYQHLEKGGERTGGANPILNLREAIKKLRKSSGKYRASMVYKQK